MSWNDYIFLICAAIICLCFVFRFFRFSVSRKYYNKNVEIVLLESVNVTATSSSSLDFNGKFEVFLSFRGPDTRRGFTDYLYTSLVGAGIHTFRDENELRIGEEIGPDLLEAIGDSKILIPIFSENYGHSKWCLRETANMVKCQRNKGQKIFPIFYDVDVSVVCNQSGSYETAFRQHEKNFYKETVEEWRNALKFIGQLRVYELKEETNGYEGEFVSKIVRDVLLELKKNYADLPDDLVGMDHHMQEMRRLLHVDLDGVRIVGIHGMGGIGKTTIAKAIYNELCDSFGYSCFLEDVRERAKSGLVDLRKQLLFQILKKDLPDILNDSDGIKKIRDVLHKWKVLVVLDDLDDKDQFDKVVGECKLFNKESRLIITTRNKEVLDAIKATCNGNGQLEAYSSYEPGLMSDKDSLKLFSKYAFLRDSPPEDYMLLSEKVTSIAARLPLVLVTLGSLFLGIRNVDRWEAKLKKLKKVQNRCIMGKLRVSFDALEDVDKKIFLDIACHFVGKDKTNSCYMWADCEFVPEDGIYTLVLRSLVKIGDDNKLQMHDYLRDLGRQIVREELRYKLSRVWQPSEALKVLDGSLGGENVEVLNLDQRALEVEEYEQLVQGKQEYKQRVIRGKEYYIRRLVGGSFNRLTNLRFLQLGCVILETHSKNNLSNLRWLEWRCCDNSMSINLNLENLVVLNLTNSTITDKWGGWSLCKVATKLKVLNLTGCTGLVRGPNLSMLKDLECLYMKMCQSIERLPEMSSLNILKKLILQSCENLHDVEGLKSLASLELLDMKSCKSIKNLPRLSNLRMLRRLSLRYCEKLHGIDGLGDLVMLESLDMNRCQSIERLPDLSSLSLLRKLQLKSCVELCEIKGVGGLVSLEHLNMSQCYAIKTLPRLSNLKMLKVLLLQDCINLHDIEGLGDLVSLEFLDMQRCKSIEKLPKLSNMRSLSQLHIGYCEKLHDIQSIRDLVSLQLLDMTFCTSVVSFPDVSTLKMLKTLLASACWKLREIHGLGDSLEKLVLTECSLIENLPDLSNMRKLKILSLRSLDKLSEINGLSGLVSLEKLDLKLCLHLSNSSLDFSSSKNLKKLNLNSIANLTEITGLEELKSLQLLDMGNCISLLKFPDLSNNKNLKTVYINGCEKLPSRKYILHSSTRQIILLTTKRPE